MKRKWWIGGLVLAAVGAAVAGALQLRDVRVLDASSTMAAVGAKTPGVGVARDAVRAAWAERPGTSALVPAGAALLPRRQFFRP